MAHHKLLVDDFYDESYSLIAIHCRLGDYRLAYLLNKHLELNLHRLDQDLDYKYFAATYSIYEWEDERKQITWNLINNVCTKEEDMLSSSGTLFSNSQKTVKTYHLLPELKNVDFLLKISCEENYKYEAKVLEQLHHIPQIITSYDVDVSKIKSKEFLIF